MVLTASATLAAAALALLLTTRPIRLGWQEKLEQSSLARDAERAPSEPGLLGECATANIPNAVAWPKEAASTLTLRDGKETTLKPAFAHAAASLPVRQPVPPSQLEPPMIKSWV